MIKNRAFAVLLCAAAALGACEKNAVQEIIGPAPTARIKFFNFGLNAPAVNFYANDTKMTAFSSATGAESTTGVAYGGVGAGDYYTAIEAGQYTLSGRIAATADKDLAISGVAATVEDGKHYSFYQSGLYNTTTKKVDGFVVEDAFPAAIDYTQPYVRFVNAIYNSSPMTLYAKHTVTGTEYPVGGPVAYKSAGAFVALPPGVYDLSTRTAGSATNLIVRTAVSFVPTRVHTIGALGDMTVTGTTATNRARLDNTTNR